MQTFLPYQNFINSAACLDNKRLGKQRVEAFQILKALKDPSYGWQNHPAVNMWRGYELALAGYYNSMLDEFMYRGFKNVKLQPIKIDDSRWATPPWMGDDKLHFKIDDSRGATPPWMGDDKLHLSHRSNLLRKNPSHYAKYGWDNSASIDMEYYWPSKNASSSSKLSGLPTTDYRKCVICSKLLSPFWTAYTQTYSDTRYFLCGEKCRELFLITPKID